MFLARWLSFFSVSFQSFLFMCFVFVQWLYARVAGYDERKRLLCCPSLFGLRHPRISSQPLSRRGTYIIIIYEIHIYDDVVKAAIRGGGIAFNRQTKRTEKRRSVSITLWLLSHQYYYFVAFTTYHRRSHHNYQHHHHHRRNFHHRPPSNLS